MFWFFVSQIFAFFRFAVRTIVLDGVKRRKANLASGKTLI